MCTKNRQFHIFIRPLRIGKSSIYPEKWICQIDGFYGFSASSFTKETQGVPESRPLLWKPNTWLCLIPPLRRNVVWIFPHRVVKPKFLTNFFEEFFWRIFDKFFLTNFLMDLLTNFFDNFFDKFFWQIFDKFFDEFF